jgi:hypothetical protein
VLSLPAAGSTYTVDANGFVAVTSQVDAIALPTVATKLLRPVPTW